MPIFTQDLRNIALVGQQGVGKTTLAEAMLYQIGIIGKMGSIKEGSTVCDYDKLEQERRFSINPALLHLSWKKKKINVLDTPGFADFIEKTRPIFKAVETALVVISPSGFSGSELTRILGYIEEEKLPKMLFINKMEEGELNFSSLLEEIKKELNITPLPLQYPLIQQGKIIGIIDLIELKAKSYFQGKAKEEKIPSEEEAKVKEIREKIVEAAAETSDELVEKYLEGEQLSLDEIRKGIREGIQQRSIVPLIFGSALNSVGIDLLLDAVVNYLPSPEWRKSVKGKTPKETSQEIERKISVDDPFSALVFLNLSEMHLGEMSFLKVYSGTLSSGSAVYNSTKDEEEKIGQIYLVQGNKREEIPEVLAGDIAVLAKLKNTGIGDTLCAKDSPIIFSPLDFSEPNTSVALKSKEEKDEQRMSVALSRMIKVDPLLKAEVDRESGQTILSGMGKVHLDLTIERIKREFNIDVITEDPKVPYRETITTVSEAQGKYKRQSGGRGQYGDVWLRVKPLSRGEGFNFVDAIKGGAVPSRFIPSVEKGVKEAMKKGILASYPMVDMEITLFDGSYHPVDSSDIAFQIAASMGLKKAVEQAKPILLEPIMELEVEVPSEFLGDINADLNSRRGKILEVQPLGGKERIKVRVPLAELKNYSTTLRSLTQGRGIFSRKFSHYERVPDEIAQKIINQATK
ncbi:elongation factor G [Candidatus Aerophobetes bacterium]|nr:elongation factor G [Candidatus Aerophobetes bacterium]